MADRGLETHRGWSTPSILLPPRLPPSLVRRRRLEGRLGPGGGRSWTLVVGPPGSGKTTLVRSWLDEYEGPWTWVSVTAAARRRSRLADLVVWGVQRARSGLPLDTLDAIDMDEEDDGVVLGALVDQLAADPTDTAPIVLVLDDVQLLKTSEWVALRQLVEETPPTLHLVMISRSDPPMPLARQRANGRLAEVRPADLAFDLAETTMLLDAKAPSVSSDVAKLLQDRTEGWAAGVRLAAMAIRDGADPGELMARFASRNSSVAEFLLEEVLERMAPDRRGFLAAVATLTTLDPELCDAVSGRTDSSVVLRSLAADGLFVTPIEHGGERYRFHPLFAELLHYETARVDPAAALDQRLRAAEWLLANDRAIEAIEHLLAAGEPARAQQVVLDHFQTLYIGAHRRDLDRWLVAIPDSVVAQSLDRAVAHCVALALIANPDGARWWRYCTENASADDDWVVSRLSCVTALYDGVRARVDDMRTHWRIGQETRPPGRTDPLDEVIATWDVRLEAVFGDPVLAVERGRALLASTRELVPDESALSILAGALDAAGDHDAALAVASRAVDRWRANGEPDLPGMVDALVVQAAAARRAGDLDAADAFVDAAMALPPIRQVPHLLIAIPMLERARIDHARGNANWRDDLLGLAEELRMGGAPDDVVHWVDATRLGLEHETVGQGAANRSPRPSATRVEGSVFVEELTNRERTILEYLAGHWSLPQIGEELHISRHTVKAHVGTIYRKLGANSRSNAVMTARRLGLLKP